MIKRNNGRFAKGHKGYWKGRELSREHRKNLGLALEGKKRPHFSEQWKKNMSLSRKGKHFSPETQFKKGQVPWIKGKTTETEPKILAKEKHPRWMGGLEDYHRKQARKIMEEDLQRKLKKGETVHHLDHNWKNNSIDNLHLFKNGFEHIKYHRMKERWIKEELNLMEV